MHGDRGSFCFGVHRLYLGASWCISFYFGSWYILFGDDVFSFLLVVYVRGRHYALWFVSFIVSCFTYGTLVIDLYYEVIHGICLLFYVLWNQEFALVYLYFPHMRLCVYWVFQEYIS